MSSGPIDLATLGIEVDASGAVEGAAQLRTLIPAAEGAEQAVEGLEEAAERGSAALRRNADAASSLRSRLSDLQTTSRETAESVFAQTRAVESVAASYGNLITRIGLTGRELEQFNALQRSGADATSLQGIQLAQLAGQYHDLADAARAAGQAEQARTQQAGSQYGQRLNESFGITRPVGDDKQQYPSSARDSARVFQDAADEAEAAAKQAAAYADQADKIRARISPLIGIQQTYNRELAEAQKLMEAGALSATEYAQTVAIAGQNRSAGVSSLLKGAVGGEAEPGAEATAAQGARLAAEADDLRAKLDPLYKIQRDYNRELEKVDALFSSGAIKANVYAQAVVAADKAQEDAIKRQNAPSVDSADRLMQRAQTFNESIDPKAKAQGNFDRAKSEADDLLSKGAISPEAYEQGIRKAKQAQDTFNGGLDEMGKKAGLSGQQMFWLLANVKDFANQVFAGGSVLTAGMQQFPMLAQIIGMAEGGFGAGLKSIGDMLVKIGLSGWGAAAGIGAAAVAVAALEYRGDAIRSGNSRATYGVGRRSGMTGPEIGQAANENADYTTAFGGSAARDAAQELAKSGNIARDSFKAVLGAVKDYAYTTDQEAGPAAKELAEALDGSSGGVDKLNAKLGFLNSSTRETYLQMVAAGDKTNAQKLLIDALVPSLERANDRLNIFQKTWNLVKNGVGGAIDAVATGLDNAITGGSLDQQLATAEANLAQAKKRQQEQQNPSTLRSFFDSFGAQDGGLPPEAKIDVDTSSAQKSIDDIRKKMADFTKSVEIAKNAAKSLEVDNLVKGLNPLDEQIKKVFASSKLMQDALNNAQLPTDKIRETEAAVAALSRQMKQLAEDARSGGAAFNEMVRSAQEGVRTVGFTEQARQVASNNYKAEEQIRNLNREPQNLIVSDPVKLEEERKKISTNPNITIEQRDQQIKDLQVQIDGYAARLKSIGEATTLNNQTVQKTAELKSSEQGGTYDRAPAQFKPMIQRAASMYGNIPQDVIAAVIQRESNWKVEADANINYKNSHARGLMQIQPGTGRELGMTEQQRVSDPTAQIEYGTKYLQKMYDQFGTLYKALAAYKAGPKATADALRDTGQVSEDGAKYATAVIRASGAQGGQSQKEIYERVEAAQMSNRRTVQGAQAEQKYELTDPEKVAAAKKNLELFDEEFVRFGSVSEEQKVKLAGMAEAFARAGTAASQTKLGLDTKFQREQLGRTSGEQQVASSLRGAGIGASTAEGEALAAQMRYNEALSTAKGLATDAWGSISQGIMSGASATDIAISALGRLESKLLQMAGDELIAKLFKGLTGGGEGSDSGGLGGLGGFISKIGGSLLGGFAGGGAGAGSGIDISVGKDSDWFADGGIMTPKGKAPLRAYSSGGVANTPQTAVFGEGSRPEAYVPLPDGRSIPVTMDRADSPATSGPVSLSATVYMNGSSGDAEADSRHSDDSARKMRETLQNMHDEMIAKDTRPGGALYRSGARRSA